MLVREDLRSELDELQRRIHEDFAEMLVPFLRALEHLGSTGPNGFAPDMTNLQSTATPASLALHEIEPLSPPLEEPPSYVMGLEPPGAVNPDALLDSLKARSTNTPKSNEVRRAISVSETSMCNGGDDSMISSKSGQFGMMVQVLRPPMPGNFMPVVTVHEPPFVEAQPESAASSKVEAWSTSGGSMGKKQASNQSSTCSSVAAMPRHGKGESRMTHLSPECSNAPETSIEPQKAKGFINSVDGFVRQLSGRSANRENQQTPNVPPESFNAAETSLEPQKANGFFNSVDGFVRQLSGRSANRENEQPQQFPSESVNPSDTSIVPEESKGFFHSLDGFIRQVSGQKSKDDQTFTTKRSLRRSSTCDTVGTLNSRNSTPQQRRIENIVNKSSFDYCIAGLIFANGVFVGIQTDFLTRKHDEDLGTGFQLAELAFSTLFTVELALRLLAFRCSFFTMEQRWWNIFDCFIVSFQLFEMFMFAVSNAGVDFSFSFFRVLRLVRVVRLARALRVIGELRTIVSSIAGSVKPLFWTGVLLCLIAYVFGVALTQLVHMKRVELVQSNAPIPEHLDVYWGSLSVTIFTLIQAITGGINWDEANRPLMETTGVEVGLLFTFYIIFCSLAMLNVVTGVFIEAVMDNSRKAKEQCTKQHVHNLFTSLNVSNDKRILWSDFERYLDSQEMIDFFNIVDVDISMAKRLFELLDADGSGCIDAGELMDGCLKLWTPAKDLDMRMVSHDIGQLRQRINELVGLVKSSELTPHDTFASELHGG